MSMTDEQDKAGEEEVETGSDEPRGGERLAKARRERQISVHEVAKELHLDEHKVRALERNDFEILGAPVFAKGHLRKYAQLVGVNEDDLFADYYQLTRQDSAPPIIVGRRRSRQELSPGPWIAVIIVIIVAAAAYWWFAVFSAGAGAPTQPAAEPVEEALLQQPRSVDAPPPAVPETAPAEPESYAGVGDSAPEPEPVASDEPATASPAADDGQVTLGLTFSGDCWTEISDATGRRLYFDMGRSGQSVQLTGTAPFAALFGNVDNVAVTLDGRDYAVTSNSPGSRTARLTLVAR